MWLQSSRSHPRLNSLSTLTETADAHMLMWHMQSHYRNNDGIHSSRGTTKPGTKVNISMIIAELFMPFITPNKFYIQRWQELTAGGKTAPSVVQRRLVTISAHIDIYCPHRKSTPDPGNASDTLPRGLQPLKMFDLGREASQRNLVDLHVPLKMRGFFYYIYLVDTTDCCVRMG